MYHRLCRLKFDKKIWTKRSTNESFNVVGGSFITYIFKVGGMVGESDKCYVRYKLIVMENL